jgi:hypothetical protein
MSKKIAVLIVCAGLCLATLAVWTWRSEWRSQSVSIETARLLLALGEHADAADVANKLIQRADDPVQDVYNAAGIFARCVPLVEPDKERAQSYSDRAVAALRQAVQNGYKDLAHMKQDKDLDPVRSHPGFQVLLKELKEPERAIMENSNPPK